MYIRRRVGRTFLAIKNYLWKYPSLTDNWEHEEISESHHCCTSAMKSMPHISPKKPVIQHGGRRFYKNDESEAGVELYEVNCRLDVQVWEKRAHECNQCWYPDILNIICSFHSTVQRLGYEEYFTYL